MSDIRRKDNFLLQAGILAAAGFISRIIGLLYRSPLTAVIGDLGIGYYQAAYNIYTIVLLISSYSIPSAISKVIAQKLSVREYRNAHRIFVCSVWYVLLIGGIAGLVLFFGAGLLVDGSAIPVLRIFAPTIFLYGLLGVLRGYFQAHRSMVQTSVSQILEQIANAAVSIIAAVLLIRIFVPGNGNAVFPESMSSSPAVYGAAMSVVGARFNSAYEVKHAMYGAMGSALGTGAGVLIGLLFMWWMYSVNRKMIQSRIQRDRTASEDSFRDISARIVLVVTPFILSTAAYNLSTAVNQTMYLKIGQLVKGMEEQTAYANYGVFSGKAVTISNIPVAFASAMAAAMIPVVASLIARSQVKEASQKVGLAVKSTMLIAIPSAVGLCVLAKPVTWLLFRQEATIDLASGLLMALSASVVLFSLSTLNSNILQGIGKVNTPIYHAVFALTVQSIVLAVLLLFTKLDLYALAIANLVYSGLMCVLNQRAVRKAIGYRQEWLRTFVIPFAASLGMGVAALGIYQGLYLLTNSTTAALFAAIILGAAVYFVLLLLLKGVNEAELKALPKGYLLVKVAKKCRIL